MASDVGDALDALSLLARARLVGALHAAGVLHDKMLLWMIAAHLCACFAPKAVGASRVHAATSSSPFEVLGLFSSVASTFGNVGQANYAAANACLDALAWSRRLQGTLGSSLQIPAVSGAGMGAATFDREQLEAMGAISLDAFAAWLRRSIGAAHGGSERTQAPLGPSLLQGVANAARSELPVQAAAPSIAMDAVAQRWSFIARSSSSQRQSHIESLILRVAHELTGSYDDVLMVNTPLDEAGLDSIASTELVHQLSSLTGLQLPSMLVFQFPSVRTIAQHVITSGTVSGPYGQGTAKPSTDLSGSSAAETFMSDRHIPVVHGPQLVTVKANGTDPLVFVHGIAGHVPHRLLARLSNSIGGGLLGIRHPLLAGQLAAPKLQRDLAELYTATLANAGHRRTHLISHSLGALIIHQMAHVMRALGCPAGAVVLIEPTSPPPYDLHLRDGWQGTGWHQAGYQLVTGLFDGRVDTQAVKSRLWALPDDAVVPCIVALFADLADGTCSLSEVLQVTRQLKVVQEMNEMLSSLEEVQSLTGGSETLVSVLATDRQRFFESQMMNDLGPNGLSKVLLFGDPAVELELCGTHGEICTWTLSGRDIAFNAVLCAVLTRTRHDAIRQEPAIPDTCSAGSDAEAEPGSGVGASASVVDVYGSNRGTVAATSMRAEASIATAIEKPQEHILVRLLDGRPVLTRLCADLRSLATALHAQGEEKVAQFCTWPILADDSNARKCEIVPHDAELTQYTLEKGIELRAMMDVTEWVELLTKAGGTSSAHILVGWQLIKLMDVQIDENQPIVVYLTAPTCNAAALPLEPPLAIRQVLQCVDAVLLIRTDICPPKVMAACTCRIARSAQDAMSCIQVFRQSRRVSLLRGYAADVIDAVIKDYLASTLGS
jgi:acyl carrier protein